MARQHGLGQMQAAAAVELDTAPETLTSLMTKHSLHLVALCAVVVAVGIIIRTIDNDDDTTWLQTPSRLAGDHIMADTVGGRVLG